MHTCRVTKDAPTSPCSVATKNLMLDNSWVGSERADLDALPPSAAYADDAPMSEAAQLDRVLHDANYLLRYAVEAGIKIDPANATRIVAATRRAARVWDTPAPRGPDAPSDRPS